MDDRLDHLRPKPGQGQAVHQPLHDQRHDGHRVPAAFATDAYRIANEGRPANIALKGDTQSGKTFLVEVLAVAWSTAWPTSSVPVARRSPAQADADLHPQRLGGVTDFDLFGQTTSYTDPVTGQSSAGLAPRHR